MRSTRIRALSRRRRHVARLGNRERGGAPTSEHRAFRRGNRELHGLGRLRRRSGPTADRITTCERCQDDGRECQPLHRAGPARRRFGRLSARRWNIYAGAALRDPLQLQAEIMGAAETRVRILRQTGADETVERLRGHGYQGGDRRRLVLENRADEAYRRPPLERLSSADHFVRMAPKAKMSARASGSAPSSLLRGHGTEMFRRSSLRPSPPTTWRPG